MSRAATTLAVAAGEMLALNIRNVHGVSGADRGKVGGNESFNGGKRLAECTHNQKVRAMGQTKMGRTAPPCPITPNHAHRRP